MDIREFVIIIRQLITGILMCIALYCSYYSYYCVVLFGFSHLLEPTLTMENLINVLADVEDWSDKGLPEDLSIPVSKVKELEKAYPDLTQRQSAIFQLFLDKHPAPSWEHVCLGLYMNDEYEILEVVQSKYFKGSYFKCVWL